MIAQRFALEKLIGRGGMGEVYRARDNTRGASVAVKVLQRMYARESEITGRFATEVRAMMRVRHPNVVEYLSAGTHVGLPYVVMQHVDGADLRAVLSGTSCGRLGLKPATALLRMICDGVHAIHESGAVHGDIKPSNVLIEVSGRAVLGDLGMARPAASCCQLPEGKAYGTPAYMAPELTTATVPVSAAASDVYALGVLAFRVITGRLPFVAQTWGELVEQHRCEAPPRPSAIRPEIPRAIDDTILRALAKEPHARPASGPAFAEELSAGLAPPLRRRLLALWPWPGKPRRRRCARPKAPASIPAENVRPRSPMSAV